MFGKFCKKIETCTEKSIWTEKMAQAPWENSLLSGTTDVKESGLGFVHHKQVLDGIVDKTWLKPFTTGHN